MDVLSRMAAAGIVPVVVLDKAEDAVPTARAMIAGGIDVMEITFRTAAAADSIRAVAAEVPEMLVGAGTVINLDQCKLAVECGAKFIVSPGYDEETVAWCVENNIAVTPGCVTPTEIMMAKKHDLKVLKFFPANVYGGLKALKVPLCHAGVCQRRLSLYRRPGQADRCGAAYFQIDHVCVRAVHRRDYDVLCSIQHSP